MTRCTPVRAPEPRLPDRLRTLARAIERLALSGRTDPEQVVMAKELIARDLRRLALEVSG
jgi:hypothetical protein